MDELWDFLKDPENRAVLNWIGSGIVALFAAAWAIFIYFRPPRPAQSAPAQSSAVQVTAQSGAFAAGGSVTIGGDLRTGINLAELRELLTRGPGSGDYERIAKQLGVTESAVANFFTILGEKAAAPKDLDAKLREIAARHKALLKELQTLRSDDPEIAGITEQAREIIDQGHYDRAEDLLKEAEQKEIAAVARMRETADKRRLSAAAIRAERGQLQLAQLAYAAAVVHFEAATNLVPESSPEIKAMYLGRSGTAMYDAGNYTAAEEPLQRALELGEKVLGPEHPR